MLEFLRARASDRKLRLFAVACCRRLWDLLDEGHCKKLVDVGLPLGCENLVGLPLNSCHRAIEMAELAADGPVSSEELRALSEAAFAFQFPAEYYCACYVVGWGQFDGELVASGEAAFAAHDASLPGVSPDGAAWRTAQAARFLRTREFGAADESGIGSEGRCHCDMLRDLFGNPFHPSNTDPAWLTPTVQKLAEVAYEERFLPSGELDLGRLAVLADALEEAGVTDANILNHLRGPGPHVRGCWVLDLLLDKK
jgi:hypothetical protein